MARRQHEVTICRQQHKFVANAYLAYQRINGPNLDSGTATSIAKLGGIHVIRAIGNEQRQGLESLHDLLTGARTREPLQQFLEYQARGYDGLASS